MQKTDKKLFNEGTADSLSSLVSQLESLSISATALLQPQGGLSSLGSSPGTWAEVRKSLHQANCLGPHHCYACGTPGVAHHLAQEAVDITLPSHPIRAHLASAKHLRRLCRSEDRSPQGPATNLPPSNPPRDLNLETRGPGIAPAGAARYRTSRSCRL